MPWLWTRHLLALRYHVPPYEIDEWPYNEVAIACSIAAIEAKAEADRAKRQARQQGR